MTAVAGRRHIPARVTDRGRLAVDLAGAVRGEVRFDRGSQAMYANDASVFRQIPIGVVIPRDTDDVVSAGCCGMAGSFGFERGQHYEVSQACGERVILPAVREAPVDTVIVADGFSCREQIGQATNRRPLHLAQVLRLAGDDPPADHPERACWEGRPRSGLLLAMFAAASLGAAGGAAALMLRRLRRRLSGRFSGGSDG